MQIIEYLDLFIGSLTNMMFYAIIIRKIFKTEMNKNKVVKYGALLFITIAILIINIYNKDFFKIIMTIPFITIGMKYIFNIKIEKAFLYSIVATFYLFIGEIFTSLIFYVLPVDYTFIFNNVMGKTSGSFVVTILTIPFLYISFVGKFFNKIISKVESKDMVIQCTLFLIVVSTLTYSNTRGVQDVTHIIMNAMLFMVYMVIIIVLYSQLKKANQLSQEYNILLEYLEKYEKEIEEKRKIIHDYKNQLIVINGYITDNNTELKQYVLEIINEQKSISINSLITNIDKLPKGLKGLIYYKCSQVDSKIKITIDISTNLNKYNNISPRLNKDVLKIIGILLDNAIEGALDSKGKKILITMNIIKNTFFCEIINDVSKKIFTKNLMNSGYSTKGHNRGYGLSIVKDIIENSNSILVNLKSENLSFISTMQVKI